MMKMTMKMNDEVNDEDNEDEVWIIPYHNNVNDNVTL